MLKLNISNEFIQIKNITHSQLPQILNWYNHTDCFKYATGIDKPMPMRCLVQKYEESVICSSEFFAGIYDSEGKMLGLVKGRIIRNGTPVIWINSIIIHPLDQRKGYGTMAVELLISYLKGLGCFKKVFVSVVEENISGFSFWYKNGFRCVRKIEKHIMLDQTKHSVEIMTKDI